MEQSLSYGLNLQLLPFDRRLVSRCRELFVTFDARLISPGMVLGSAFDIQPPMLDLIEDLHELHRHSI